MYIFSHFHAVTELLKAKLAKNGLEGREANRLQ
jgi:hypothetical protein